MKKILFTGGGSAGHVVPNLALIEELVNESKADVCYMGTDGIEKRLVSEWKIPYYQITCPKLIRKGGLDGLKNNLRIPTAFFQAVKQAQRGLKIFRPDAVFSKGGYVALPVVFAAKRLKIPCYAHESDYSLGLANLLSARACAQVFTSFPETAQRLRNGKYSGAPLRRELFTERKETARQKLSVPKGKPVLLVFGGGSGSAVINDAVRANLKSLTDKYFVLHVCGRGNAVRANLKGYCQMEYFSDMGVAYAAADVVVCRSGAGTMFELVALKKPAVCIPLEGQTRGDQKENAEYFAKRGLCRLLPQTAINRLEKEIEIALCDEKMRTRLQENAYTAGNKIILEALL
jgi:UDP-N-acetylglucosamine--N-acetylmuramyl-(pentapeptide) pyrophosphoryl-undecaprenol N-acetylglucosamine transferase